MTSPEEVFVFYTRVRKTFKSLQPTNMNGSAGIGVQ